MNRSIASIHVEASLLRLAAWSRPLDLLRRTPRRVFAQTVLPAHFVAHIVEREIRMVFVHRLHLGQQLRWCRFLVDPATTGALSSRLALAVAVGHEPFSN